ncbi:MAG: LacI family DNA-binding transcriptional regulator [Lachnospiraceae bacterium]
MTLKEIANEAGVSISTVSRVVNNSGTNAASKEVRDRIWEIVRRSGYTPNSSARNLKMGHSQPRQKINSLACMFARTPNDPNDPFFSTIARGVEIEALKHDYLMKLSFSSIDINEPETSRFILNNEFSGVVILGRCDKATLKFLKHHFHYVVYTGLNSIDANFDQILCDGYEATLSVMKHLVDLGHKNIGYLGDTSLEVRYTGYKAALERYQIPFRKEYTHSIELVSNQGYQGAKELLTNCPDLTAIFCGNDITAIGAIRAIKDMGLKIPKDISVISIDDIDTAQYLSPMLTTIHIPTLEMGQQAAKTIIDRINGGHSVPLKVNLPFYLARRESCGKPIVR